MSHESTVSFPVPGGATLHLPWQGSWQVSARRLRQPVDVMGAHLPLFAWETPDGWTLARYRVGDDDAVWGLRLTAGKGRLEVRLQGDWRAAPEWSVESCPDRAALIDRSRAGLPPPPQNPAPEPLRRMFILDIHNPRGDLIQRFDDVTAFVTQCADLGVARGSLLYLPGWSGPFDGNYPDYEPAPDAGGPEGLARLAQVAREHGARVAPHWNHWALSQKRISRYPQFADHILRDANGKQAGWPGAMLLDISHPLQYVDPSSEVWLEHISGRVRALEELGVDTAMFDQVAPPLGDNWRRQTRGFIREIHRRHPRVLLGSESVHADLLGELGFAQLWGPVWSAMPEVPVLKPSPFLADVVRPWLPIVGHLASPAPYPAPYAWTQYVYLAEQGPARMFKTVGDLHRASGVLPTVRLVSTRRRPNERFLKKMMST